MSGEGQAKDNTAKAQMGFLDGILAIFSGNKTIKVGLMDIPAYIGRHMIPEMHNLPNPDHWVEYKMLARPRVGQPNLYDVRVIDVFESRGGDKKINSKITDFDSLDNYSELIQFEGWFNSRTHQCEIKAVTRKTNIAANPGQA